MRSALAYDLFLFLCYNKISGRRLLGRLLVLIIISHMKKTLKVLLYLFTAYHLFLGITGVLLAASPEIIKTVVALAFNFNITYNDQSIWMIRLAAAYLLIAGIMGYFAAKDPVHYKPMVYIAAVLMFIRVVQRSFFALEGSSFLVNASPMRNLIGIVILTIYGLSIVLLAQKVEK